MIGEPQLPTAPPALLFAAALAADSWIGEDVPLLDFADELSDLAFMMDIVVFLSDILFDKIIKYIYLLEFWNREFNRFSC